MVHERPVSYVISTTRERGQSILSKAANKAAVNGEGNSRGKSSSSMDGSLKHAKECQAFNSSRSCPCRIIYDAPKA